MEKTEKVQPTFVIFSPYKLRHNKWIECVAKHNSLVLAILSLICVIGFRQDLNGILSIVYLPPCVFYSIVYLFCCNYKSKRFVFTQIIFTHVFLIYTPYFMLVAPKNVRRWIMIVPGFISWALILQTFVLQIVHRRYYTKDLSTAESVSTLNKRDAYHIMSFCYDVVGITIVTVLCLHIFPSYLEVKTFEYYIMVTLSALLACLGPLCVHLTLDSISHLNTGKENVDSKLIQYDSDGRAWCALIWNATEKELYSKDEKVVNKTPIFTVIGHKYSRISPQKFDL